MTAAHALKIPYAGKAALDEPLMPEPTSAELRIELRERDIEIAALKAQLKGQEAATAAAIRLLEPYTRRLNGNR